MPTSPSGYTFTPQFAQTGALQALQPLDVTRKADFQFRPLSQIEIQSSRPELVAQGIAKGIESAVGGITSGITAKWKAEQEKEAATTKYKRDFILAGIRAGKDDDSWWDKQEARFISEHGGDADFEERLAALRSARPTISKSLPEGVKNKTPTTTEVVDAELPTENGSYNDVSLAPGGKTIAETQKGAYQGTPAQKAAQEAEDARVAPVSATYEPPKPSRISFGAGLLEPTADEITQTPALVNIAPATSATQAPPAPPPALAAVTAESVTQPAQVAPVESKLPEVDYNKYPKPELPAITRFKTRAEAEAAKQSIEVNPDYEVVVSKPDSKGWTNIELKSKRKDRIDEERKVVDDYQKKLDRTEKQQEKLDKQQEGKTLLDSQINKIIALKSAAEDLNSIEARLNNIPSKYRGPIGGFLAGKNPYSAEIQALNSQVVQIVPGLARGVFGEVGVLNEADITRYTKTIPDIQKDPKVAQQVIKELREKLKRSETNTISGYEKAGFNVGKFKEGYFEPIKQEKNTLISEKDALLTKIATGSDEYKKSAEYQKDYNRALQISGLIK